MRWAEVARAVAFKRDLLTVDCICLLLARAEKTAGVVTATFIGGTCVPVMRGTLELT